MKYKLVLKVSILMFAFTALAIAESDALECPGGWRPFKELLKRREFKKQSATAKRSTPKIDMPLRLPLRKVRSDTELGKRVKKMQDAISNFRAENLKNIRNRREMQKRKRDNLMLRRNFVGLQRDKPRSRLDVTDDDTPGNNAVRIVRNLKELHDSSRSLAKKGLEFLEKALA